MYRRIFNLSLPLILSNISLPLCGVINSALMGHLTNSRYLAATALGGSILVFIAYLFSFLRMSTTGTIAQHYAKKEWDLISLWVSKSLLFCVVISLSIFLLQQPIKQLFLFFSGESPNVTALLNNYYRIGIYALFFVLVNYVFLGFFIGIQKTYLGLIMSLAQTSLSILFSVFFVLGMHKDVGGIAMSLLLSEALSSCLGLYYVINTFQTHHTTLKKHFSNRAVFQLNTYRCFFSVNSHLFIRSLCILIAIQSFTFLSSHFSKDILAVNQLLFQFSFLIALSLDAFSNATETLVGYSYAKNDPHELRTVIRTTHRYFIIMTLCFVGTYALTYPWIINQLTTISTLRGLAHQYVIYSILLPLCTTHAFWLDGIFVGLLKAKTMRNAMLLSLLGYFLCLIGLWHWKNDGLWCAILLFFIFRAITLCFPLYQIIKKSMAST